MSPSLLALTPAVQIPQTPPHLHEPKALLNPPAIHHFRNPVHRAPRRLRDVLSPTEPRTLPHKRPKTAVTQLMTAREDCFVPEPEYPVTGRSPLHVAVMKSRFDEVRRLLAAGADVHARDSNGETPLHYAAECDYIHMLEILLHYGADPFAVDNMGDTPMHGAAVMGRSATTLLLAQTMRNKQRPLPMWPNPAKVHETLTRFKLPKGNANVYTAVDRFINTLVGCPINLNHDFDVLKYVGHVLNLDKYVVGELPAEGWNQVAFFYQRLRSFLQIYLNPQPLPPSLQSLFTVDEIKTLLEREIVGILTSLNVRRHVGNADRLNESAREALCTSVAEHVVEHVCNLKLGEGFTLPLGTPSHAIYMNLMPTLVGDQEVVTFRLDNLGLGYELAASLDSRGRLPAFAFNLPTQYLHSAAGRERLGKLVAKLIQYKIDPRPGMDMVYAQLTMLLRELHGTYPTLLVDAVDQSKYASDPQRVGNCSLENHSAGVWTRLAMAVETKLPNAPPDQQHRNGVLLWSWLKEQEIVLALRRMHEFVVTPKAILYRHEKKRAEELRSMIAEGKSGGGALVDFLQQPLRATVAGQLSCKDVVPLVQDGQMEEMRALLAHGLQLRTKTDIDGGTLLHTAVRSESRQSAAMVRLLLEHGVNPATVDDRGRTPFLLAAQLGRADTLQVLAPHASDTDRLQARHALTNHMLAMQTAMGTVSCSGASTTSNTMQMQVGGLAMTT